MSGFFNGRQAKRYLQRDGSLTRSGLLKHVERLLTESVLYGIQPKYLLMENVKGLVSKKFIPDFQRWLDKLEQLGYNNYWQVLNAKDYGIPQNRERVFVVSIRKDIDTKGYKFPSSIPLKLRLKDMLELCVDEKYYLSDDKVEKLTAHGDGVIEQKTTNRFFKQGLETLYENDTVLDFTMGSGSTGVACKNLNRNFIGIELDKNYFEIAQKRIGGI